MTRLWLLSDLHLDWSDNREHDLTPPGDAEIAIVLGDLGGTLDMGIQDVARIVGEMPCVVVAGNHDFYTGGDPPRPTMAEIWSRARETASAFPNIHLLENQAVVLDGTRFLGCSLWTDGWSAVRRYSYSPKGSMVEMGQRMNDYRRIRTGPTTRHRLEPRDTVAMHRASVNWLRAELADGDLPTVVCTHHGPDPGSAASYKEVAQAYWSDLTPLIEEHGPDVWLHGHTHHVRDDVVGRTRMVSNPVGYPGERTGWQADLVIEVGMGWDGPR